MKDLCKKLEHYETPEWAVDAILKHEKLIGPVVDPCTGTGILAKAASRYTQEAIITIDIHNWGYPLTHQEDFLKYDDSLLGCTVLMNPPFSKSTQFVTHAFTLKPRKIICFQRFAWWESAQRRSFWDKYPPNRVYICGNRATCWRHDIQDRRSSSSAAHAWFIWDTTRPFPATELHRLYK